MDNFVNLVELYKKGGSFFAVKAKHYLLNQTNNNPIDDHLGYTVNDTFVNKKFTWMIGLNSNHKQILLTRADEPNDEPGTTLLKALNSIPFELQYLGKMKVTTDMTTLNIMFSLTSTSVYVDNKAIFEETTLKPLIQHLLTEKGMNVNVMHKKNDITNIPDINNLISENKADVYRFDNQNSAITFKANIEQLYNLQHQLKDISPILQQIKDEQAQIQAHTLRLNDLESNEDMLHYKKTLIRIKEVHDLLKSERPMTLGGKVKRKTKNVRKKYGKSRRVK